LVVLVLGACGGGGGGCPNAEFRVEGNDRDRARMAQAAEAAAVDVAAVALHNALSEERRRQLGVPALPPKLVRGTRLGAPFHGDGPGFVGISETDRDEFRIWLDHPERLPGAAPGVTGNPLRAMAEQALRDGRFDDALERVGLRCGEG
jgi:hypothetical protein